MPMYRRWVLSSLERQKGQILLIVVLVMVISLTVGLSVASKSITSLRTSTEEANSQKALSAAEAGIEQQIKNNVSIGRGQLSSDASYTTSITPVLGTSFLLNGSNPVLQDDGIDLWLSDYSTDSSKIYLNSWPAGGGTGQVTIYWGDSSVACNNSALEIAVITGSKASSSIARYALDPCASRAATNHLASPAVLPPATVEGKLFYHQTTITITSGLIAKIIPLYTNTHLAVTGTAAIPSQGSVISSTGTSGSSERKVNVFQGYPEIPSEYFPYVLFSP